MLKHVGRVSGLVVALAATVLMRIPIFRSSRFFGFDEGVYGVSVLAMRSGEAPFADIFSSQGPLFLPALRLIDILGFEHFRALRAGMVVAAIAATLGVYFLGLRLTESRFAAAVAALIVGTSSSGVIAAAPVQSDGIALAFGVWAVAVAIGIGPLGRSRPVVTGVLLGLGLSVKSLFVVPALLAVAWLWLRDRSHRELVWAALAAAAVGLAVTVPWGVADVWDQYVVYQLEVRRTRNPVSNLVESLSLMSRRDPLFLAASGLAALTGLGRALSGGDRGRRLGADPILVWALAAASVLLFGVQIRRGTYRFLVFFFAPAALLIARSLPPARVTAAALAVPVLVIAINYDAEDGYLAERRPTATDREVVAMLEALPPGARVISDQPGLAWMAGRHPPPHLVDVSWARIRSGNLTVEDVMAGAAHPETCAVLFYSQRFDFLDPGLAGSLPGYELVMDWENDQRLYVRSACR